jgi:hypothetical protein
MCRRGATDHVARTWPASRSSLGDRQLQRGCCPLGGATEWWSSVARLGDARQAAQPDCDLALVVEIGLVAIHVQAPGREARAMLPNARRPPAGVREAGTSAVNVPPWEQQRRPSCQHVEVGADGRATSSSDQGARSVSWNDAVLAGLKSAGISVMAPRFPGCAPRTGGPTHNRRAHGDMKQAGIVMAREPLATSIRHPHHAGPMLPLHSQLPSLRSTLSRS